MEWSENLWNEGAETPRYGAPIGGYLLALLEQYKLYVEMSDRVSQRRGLTNTFFLTMNTGVLTAIAVFLDRPLGWDPAWLALPAVGLIGQCVAWYSILRSYRLLNAAKYRVIGAMEERLPASPYVRAEWAALGEGKDRRLYWPLTHIEKWVPVLFALVYVGGLVAALVAE